MKIIPLFQNQAFPIFVSLEISFQLQTAGFLQSFSLILAAYNLLSNK